MDKAVNITLVDFGSTSEKVARFRAELRRIGAENRQYADSKHHREEEIAQHQRRQDRILEIKAELEGMLKLKPCNRSDLRR